MQQNVQSGSFIAITFSPDMLISALSLEAEHWTGYSARDMVGRPITQLLDDRCAFEVPRMIECARKSGIWEGSLVLVNRSGEPLCSWGNVSTLAGSGRSDPGFLLVSALSHQAAPTAEERTALQQAGAKLRELSHEMNNPLAVLMGFMQLVMLNPQCSGKVRADVETMYSEMNRLVQVCDRLHRYAISLQEEPRHDLVGLDARAG
jgi:nitrogen-specific signal transduction histidine kinase